MKQRTKLFPLILLLSSQLMGPVIGIAETKNGETIPENKISGKMPKETTSTIEGSSSELVSQQNQDSNTESSNKTAATIGGSSDEKTLQSQDSNTESQEKDSKSPSISTTDVITGVNGTSSWTFQNGILTFSEGDLKQKISKMTEIDPQTITKINFAGNITIPSLWSETSNFFADLSNLIGIDNGRNLNFSNISEPYYLFMNDSKLEYVDTSNWDTSKMIRTTGMFLYCKSLKTVDVSNWNMSNVIDLGNMFNGCSSIDNLDVSNWDTSKVANLDKTFNDNQNLSKLDISKWNTSKVTNMFATFGNLTKLKELDVSNWDVSNVIYSNYMFNGLSNVEKLDVSKWNVSNMSDMVSIFQGDSSLSELDLSNWNNEKATSPTNLLKGTVKLKKLSLSPSLKDKNSNSVGFNIPAIQKDDNYTGNWQNIGVGTAEEPLGDYVIDSKTLSHGSPSQNVETFIWQPTTLKGSDYTMTLGDSQPTTSDFKASATDKNGNPEEITIDFSKVDFNTVGTYDVTLSAKDGQSKVVKLTIENKKVATSKVTFIADKGGSLQGPASVDVPKGTKLSDLPKIVADKSKIEDIYFLDWYQNGKIVNPKNVTINSDTTFTAKFGTAVYRLYNKNNGDHLLTKNKNEKNKIEAKGWKVETNPKKEYGRAAFYVPVQADSAGKKQVYRIYNPNSGEHFYTTNKSEADAAVKKGWKHETDNNYTWVSEGDVKIYREFNPDVHTAGSHNFTTDLREHKNVVKAGWRDESKNSSLWTVLKAGF